MAKVKSMRSPRGKEVARCEGRHPRKGTRIKGPAAGTKMLAARQEGHRGTSAWSSGKRVAWARVSPEVRRRCDRRSLRAGIDFSVARSGASGVERRGLPVRDLSVCHIPLVGVAEHLQRAPAGTSCNFICCEKRGSAYAPQVSGGPVWRGCGPDTRGALGGADAVGAARLGVVKPLNRPPQPRRRTHRGGYNGRTGNVVSSRVTRPRGPASRRRWLLVTLTGLEAILARAVLGRDRQHGRRAARQQGTVVRAVPIGVPSITVEERRVLDRDMAPRAVYVMAWPYENGRAAPRVVFVAAHFATSGTCLKPKRRRSSLSTSAGRRKFGRGTSTLQKGARSRSRIKGNFSLEEEEKYHL